ncbi:MAG: fumarylacetoacetate hydrolase family protein [Beijerinckiaceae bacterium]|nr:fumarylacetoacetate hydrolase family protein [Beijerinckiaceae bacterium]
MPSWVRFRHDGTDAFGRMSADGASIEVFEGDMFREPKATGTSVPAAGATLLAPVAPGKFIGLWNNFHELAAKLGAAIPDTPLYFLKGGNSLAGPETAFSAPPSYQGKTVYEGELGVVIGRTCRNVDEQAAEAAIFGYTCVNDLTALDLLTENPAFPQWARAKSCDGYGPVGPCIVTGFDWSAARVRTLLNGRERQNYPLGDMILPPARIVSLLSREMTLEPGDLIACGTSVGVLPMRPGMEVEVAIDGIGSLRNRFVAAAEKDTA